MLYLQIKKSKLFPYLLVFCNFLPAYGAQLPETEEIIIQENSGKALPPQPLNVDTIYTTELDQKDSDIYQPLNDHDALQSGMLDEKTLGIDSLDVALKNDKLLVSSLEYFSLLKSSFEDSIRETRRASKKLLSESLSEIMVTRRMFTSLIEESAKDKKKNVLERMNEITALSLRNNELTQKKALALSQLNLQRKEVETKKINTNLEKMKETVDFIAYLQGKVLDKNRKEFYLKMKKKADIFAENNKRANAVADYSNKVKKQKEAIQNIKHKNKMSQLRDEQEIQHQSMLQKIEQSKQHKKSSWK